MDKKTVAGPLSSFTAVSKELKSIDTNISKLHKTSDKHNELLSAILSFLKLKGEDVKSKLIGSRDFDPIISAFDEVIDLNAKGLKATTEVVKKSSKKTNDNVEAQLKSITEVTKREKIERTKFDDLERKKKSKFDEEERQKQANFNKRERGQKEVGRKKLEAVAERERIATIRAEKNKSKQGSTVKVKDTIKDLSVARKNAIIDERIAKERARTASKDRGKDIVQGAIGGIKSKVKEKRENTAAAIKAIKDEIKTSANNAKRSVSLAASEARSVAKDSKSVAMYLASLAKPKRKSKPAAPTASASEAKSQNKPVEKAPSEKTAEKAKEKVTDQNREQRRQEREARQEKNKERMSDFKKKSDEAKAKAAQNKKNQATHAKTSEDERAVQRLKITGHAYFAKSLRGDKSGNDDSGSGSDYDRDDKDKEKSKKQREKERKERAKKRLERRKQSRSNKLGKSRVRLGRGIPKVGAAVEAEELSSVSKVAKTAEVSGKATTVAEEAGNIVSKSSKVLGTVGRVGGGLLAGAGVALAGADLYSNFSKADDASVSEQERSTAKHAAYGGTAGAVLGGLVGLLGGPMGAMIGASIGETLGSTIGEYSGEISETLESAADYMEKGALKVITPLSNLAAAAGHNIEDAASFVEKGIENNVINPITSVVKGVPGFITGAADTFEKGFAGLSPALTSAMGVAVLGPLALMNSDNLSSLKDTFEKNIVPGIESVFGPLSNFSKKFESFEDGLKDLASGAWNKAKQVGGGIANAAQQAGEGASNLAHKAWSGVKSALGISPEAVKAANSAQEKYGVPAAITLGQYGLESGGGKHMPTGSNNPFGIKANKDQIASGQYVEAMTTEHVNGQDVRVPQKFAKYNSLDESFEAHAKLLANGKAYGKARGANSIEDYAKALTGTYATDPNYDNKLLSVISRQQIAQTQLASSLGNSATTLDSAQTDWSKSTSTAPKGGPTVEAAAKLPPMVASPTNVKPASSVQKVAYSPTTVASTTALAPAGLEAGKLYKGHLDADGNIVPSILTPKAVPAVYSAGTPVMGQKAGFFSDIEEPEQTTRELPTTELPPQVPIATVTQASVSPSTMGNIGSLSITAQSVSVNGANVTNQMNGSQGTSQVDPNGEPIQSFDSNGNVYQGNAATLNRGGPVPSSVGPAGAPLMQNRPASNTSSPSIASAFGALGLGSLGTLFNPSQGGMMNSGSSSIIGSLNSAYMTPSRIGNSIINLPQNLGQMIGGAGGANVLGNIGQIAPISKALGGIGSTVSNFGSKLNSGPNAPLIRAGIGGAGLLFGGLSSLFGFGGGGADNAVSPNTPGQSQSQSPYGNVINSGGQPIPQQSSSSDGGFSLFNPSTWFGGSDAPNTNTSPGFIPGSGLGGFGSAASLGGAGGSGSGSLIGTANAALLEPQRLVSGVRNMQNNVTNAITGGGGSNIMGNIGQIPGVGESIRGVAPAIGNIGGLAIAGGSMLGLGGFGSSSSTINRATSDYSTNNGSNVGLINRSPTDAFMASQTPVTSGGRITEAMPSSISVDRAQFSPPSNEPPDIIMPEMPVVQAPAQQAPQAQRVSSGGSGNPGTARPNMEDIPININDSGLMLLNVGYL